MGRGDLTDAAWVVLEPLLPVAPTGRRARNRRVQINGIRWRIRAGCPWRDVPERFGPWQSLYRVLRAWQRDGTWRAVVARLQTLADADDAICWEFNVDSTIARAHQHAAGARRNGAGQIEPPGGVAQEPRDTIPPRDLARILPTMTRTRTDLTKHY